MCPTHLGNVEFSHSFFQLFQKRKFALDYLTRDDIVALTKEAAEVSGITYVMEADKEEAEKILNSWDLQIKKEVE